MKRSRAMQMLLALFLVVVFQVPLTAVARTDGQVSRTEHGAALYIGTHPSSSPTGLFSLSSRPATSTSSNWCGYVAQTSFPTGGAGTVSDVKATWSVPFVMGGTTDAYSANWIGIDGYSSFTVEQLGTEQDWIGGKAFYGAWWEMVPDNFEQFIRTLVISPGDVMSAEVRWISGDQYSLSMTDVTTGHSFATVQRMTTSTERRSAEWIVEAPTIETTVGTRTVDVIATFPNLGPSPFSACSLAVNGTTGSISNTIWQYDPVVLATDPGGALLAAPSALSVSGTAFVVTAPGADLIPPTTTSDATASYDNVAVIHLTATDDAGGSGVLATHYRVDGGATQTGNVATVSTYGPHTLTFWSVDLAGNVETPHMVSFLVNDTIPPTTTSDVRSSYIGAALIHLTATDNVGGSGVAATNYTLDGRVQQRYAAVPISVTATGTHTLTFWSVDKAGNVEPTHTATFSIAPQVQTSLSLSVSATSLLRYKYVGLSSTLSGGVPAGTLVRYEVRRPGSSTFVLAANRPVDASGRASLRYKLMSRGYYYFRVRFLGNASYRASTSPVKRVRSR
jgi:hypothetical protein